MNSDSAAEEKHELAELFSKSAEEEEEQVI